VEERITGYAESQRKELVGTRIKVVAEGVEDI
jgi:hypothetical protein